MYIKNLKDPSFPRLPCFSAPQMGIKPGGNKVSGLQLGCDQGGKELRGVSAGCGLWTAPGERLALPVFATHLAWVCKLRDARLRGMRRASAGQVWLG